MAGAAAIVALGVLLGAITDVAPPVWGVVQLGVSATGGNGPASADFSNFMIT
jgi:hypothetical protein